MKHVFFASISLAVFAAACSTTVVNQPGDGDGGVSPAPTGTTAPGTDASTPTPTTPPPASTTDAQVEVGAACPAFGACGGTLDGTYDYTGGCLGDLLAPARARCPSLDASKAKVAVRGSLHFSGAALSRNIQSTVSGSVVFPATCTAGQCAAVESSLVQAGFPGTKCSGSSDCTCTLSRVDTRKDTTTFTTNGTTVTTGDGEAYEICAKGADLAYSGTSAGAEDGTWTLKKR